MADSNNLVLNLLITARDEASAAFGKLFRFLDTTTSATAMALRGALSGVFGGAVDDAMAFEAALSRVQSKSKASAEEMQKLKQAALESGQSATSAAQALEILTGAGLTVDQALSALGPTLAVVKTEQVSADVAARALTDTLSIMGLQMTDAARVGDKLQASADATSTSVTALAEAFREGGSGAVAAGLSFEQTVTILTAFAKSGLQGSEAGTALKAVLRDLGDATGPARQELAKLGLASGNVGEMVEVLAKSGARGQAAIRAFSDEAGPGLNALLQVGVKGLADYQTQIDSAEGGLQKAAATIQDNALGALDRLQAAWNRVKLALTGPVLEPIAVAAKQLSEQFTTLAESGVLERIGQSIAETFGAGSTAIIDWLKQVDWEGFSTRASQAVTTVKTTLSSMITEVQGSVQTISGWTTTVFSPVTVAVDGYRLAWLMARGETEKAAAVQERIEQTSAAIGRALSGTSGELAKNTAATTQQTAANEQAAHAQQMLAGDIQSAKLEIEAYRQQLTETAAGSDRYQITLLQLVEAKQRLAKMTGQVVPLTQEEAAALERVKTTGVAAAPALEQVATGAAKAAPALASITKGTAEAAPIHQAYVSGVNSMTLATGQQTAEWYKQLPAAERLAIALAANADETGKSQDRTAQLTAEIARVREAGDRWRSGLELNVVTLNSLRDTAELTHAKLAELEQRQRNGENLDKEVAAAKQAAIEAQSRYNQALDENIKQQERAVAAAQRATTLAQGETDLKLQQVKAEIELAEAKGDTEKATQKQNEATALELEKIQQGINGKQQEIAAYQELIAATQRKLAADGELDASDKNQLATMQDTLTGLQQEQRGLEQTKAATEQLAAAKKEKAQADQEAAEAAKNAKEAEESRTSAGKAASKVMSDSLGILKETGGEMDKLTKRFYEQQGAITQHAKGWDGWAAGTARAAQEVKQAHETQKAAVDGMTGALDRFNETGEYNASVQQAMIQASGSLEQQFDLMDQQSFDNLRSKLEAANQKLREMQQEAQDATDRLAEINAEIAAERGDAATSDRLKLELEGRQAIADLDEKIAKAQMYGNRQLLEALSEQRIKLQELYSLKEKNLEKDIESRQEQERTAKSQNTTTGNSGGTSKAGSGGTFNLNLNAGGKTLPATTTTDPSAFLAAIEQAQRSAA